MTDSVRVAFKLGATKRSGLPNLQAPTGQFEASTSNDTEKRESVTGFHNGEIKSSTPTVVKQELVLPSQPNLHHQFFNRKKNAAKVPTSTKTVPLSFSVDNVEQIEDAAKRALILEAKAANEAWEQRNEDGRVHVHTIAQDSSNTFMKTLENVDETPKEADIEDADYDQVPIDDFGMGALRGMGYKESSGLGISNRKTVDVFVPEVRPRGLGLGADRKVLEKINALKRNLKDAGIDEKDDLCFEKGAFVRIEKGPHCDLYGTIEGIDEDVTRLTVALAIGGTNKKKESISISQYNVKLVTQKEFLKYSKYVNKSKAEKVEQETSEKLMKDYYQKDDNDDVKRHRSSKNDDYERKHHHRSSNRNDDDYKHHRSSKKHDEYDRKHHRHDESSRSKKH